VSLLLLFSPRSGAPPVIVTATLTGTITSAATSAHVVAGGRTIILTLINDTWVPAGAAFDAQRQNILNGLDSAQAEALGWDAVRAALPVSSVVRTSDTVVTITLTALPTYVITATETITATIPGTALTAGSAVVAAPTFSITVAVVVVIPPISGVNCMTFLQLYGEELSLQLSSDQMTKLFATVRRKAQINNGMREFVRLTECVKKNGPLPLGDGQVAYDLEATFLDYWWLSQRRSLSIAINDGTRVRYLVEGKGLTRADVRRLDREHPGWRQADPGTPRYFGIDDDGGATNLFFYPPPRIGSGETWTATVPYVPHVPDMSADDDEPFTFAGNAAIRLCAWQLACVHYAAYKLETSRKRLPEAREQLQYFSALVKDYLDKQQIPGGDVVSFAHDYLNAGVWRGGFAGDPLVDW
jgi:hypothetical protein